MTKKAVFIGLGNMDAGIAANQKAKKSTRFTGGLITALACV